MYVNRIAKNLRVGDKIVDIDIQHSTLADLGSLTIRTVVSHERRFSTSLTDCKTFILTQDADSELNEFVFHPDDSVIVEV
jgi:hypothetical protein